ncbi:MAG: hypothetical protein F9K29_24450 [Hyphomicrobiaceae bacterium]|nr:MAG: hypothetical protein F9K29_24450 [Hyphomicrobiaceae bacterium]
MRPARPGALAPRHRAGGASPTHDAGASPTHDAGASPTHDAGASPTRRGGDVGEAGRSRCHVLLIALLAGSP